MASVFGILCSMLLVACYGYKGAVIEHQSVTPSGPVHSAADAAKINLLYSNCDAYHIF